MNIKIFLALAGFFSLQSIIAQRNADVKLLLQEDRPVEAEALVSGLPDYDGKSFDLALTKLCNGKQGEAVAIIDKALAQNPKDQYFMALKGGVALLDNRKEEAVLSFDKVLKSAKKDPFLYEVVGKLCLIAQPADIALAQKYAIQGLEVHGQSPIIHAMQGDIFFAGKNYGDAANSFQRALYYKADDAQSQRKIGLVYAVAKNYAQALEAFQQSAKTNPRGVRVYQNLGDLYYTFGKYADADKAYATYLANVTPTQEDIERYAFTLFYAKKYDESSKLIEGLIEKTERPAVLYRLKGYMAHEMKHNEEGRTFMEKFFAVQKQENILPSDYGCYGELLAALNNDSLAIVQLEKAVLADTTSMEYMDDLAKVLSKNKQHDRVIPIFEKMIAMGADPATYYFNIGKEWYFMGDEMSVCIQSNPQSEEVAATLMQQRTAYYNKAVEAFSMILKYSPNYAGAYLWCGRVHSILDPEAIQSDAKQNYEQALNLLEKVDVQKNTKMIVECLKYLGSYYYLASERAEASLAQEMKKTSVDYFSKVLQYNPEDGQSKEIIEKLKL